MEPAKNPARCLDRQVSALEAKTTPRSCSLSRYHAHHASLERPAFCTAPFAHRTRAISEKREKGGLVEEGSERSRVV